jgi:hypothetical protein
MNRRAFLCGAATILGAPLAVQAQQGEKLRRMGVLTTFSSEHPQRDLFDAFRRGLRELGYVESQNIVIEHDPHRARPSASRISSQS